MGYKINFLATKIVIYLTINENTRTQDEKKKMETAKHEAIHRTTRKNEKNEKSVVKIYQNVLKIKRTFKNGTVKIISDQKLQLVHKHCYENDVREKNFKRLIEKTDILPPFNSKTDISLEQNQSTPKTKKKREKQQQPDTIKTL